jgi:cytochrome c biogenesis protein CcdA
MQVDTCARALHTRTVLTGRAVCLSAGLLVWLDTSQFLALDWVVALFVAVFLLLALSLFGAFSLTLPQCVLNRLSSVYSSGNGEEAKDRHGAMNNTYVKALLRGLLFGFIVSPCVGPFAARCVHHTCVASFRGRTPSLYHSSLCASLKSKFLKQKRARPPFKRVTEACAGLRVHSVLVFIATSGNIVVGALGLFFFSLGLSTVRPLWLAAAVSSLCLLGVAIGVGKGTLCLEVLYFMEPVRQPARFSRWHIW